MPRRLAFPRRSHSRQGVYPGARRGPLDNNQKAALCMLAREAYEHCVGPIDDAKAFEAWRHHEQVQAIGKDSLRFATQEDYKPLLAHFLNLKGESGKAFGLLCSHQTSEADLARFKLREALAKAGLDESYAETICRAQNRGLTIDELQDAKPIWRLIFTITNRGDAKKRKGDPF